MTAPWPMDKVAKLLECAAEGMSAGQIGALLGMTRNAIIGKAARIKLQLLGRSGNNMKPPQEAPQIATDGPGVLCAPGAPATDRRTTRHPARAKQQAGRPHGAE